jgi:hypothetical protein
LVRTSSSRFRRRRESPSLPSRRPSLPFFAQRNRVKVAVVATRNGLGSVRSLFNKPKAYAKFLGLEIATVYVGPLLIVMPAGFGIYDGGRSTAAENRVLAKFPQTGRSADALTRAVANAVRKLTAAKALRSKDLHPPAVFPQTAFVHAGETAKLTYLVLEDSERRSEVVRVFVGATEADSACGAIKLAP